MRGTSVHHYLHTVNYVCILLVISDMHTLVVRLHVYYMVHACVYVYSSTSYYIMDVLYAFCRDNEDR